MEKRGSYYLIIRRKIAVLSRMRCGKCAIGTLDVPLELLESKALNNSTLDVPASAGNFQFPQWYETTRKLRNTTNSIPYSCAQLPARGNGCFCSPQCIGVFRWRKFQSAVHSRESLYSYPRR